MSQNTLQQLPEKTVKLITSTQIITSVGTAVKELIENSIDAGSKVIQVRLENYGLDLIEVKDDGSGISYDNVQKMFLPGYTSKIRQFEDLDNLQSYGFRGEALAAICKIGNVSVTTKTNLDTLAMTYEIDLAGLPVSSKPSHLNKGTVISISNLFFNLPVRRLFLSSKKKICEELKKTEHIVQSLSLIHPELGISLIHNKCPIWRKNAVRGIKQSFMQVAGLKIVSNMEYLNKLFNQLNVDLIVPKKSLENADIVFTNSVNSVYVYVNKRPVNCKILSVTVQEHIFHHYGNSNISFKYAVSLISVILPPQQIDINLEPNKTRILLKNPVELIRLIDEMLRNYYGHHDYNSKTLKNNGDITVDEEPEQQSKRARLEPVVNSAIETKTEEFKERNKDWEVEIINDDSSVISNFIAVDTFQNENSDSSIQDSCPSQSLCSQININNCVLTTEEVSELNSALNETNHKLLISKNSSNCETRLINRGDIQSRTVEKPELKDWPCRPKTTINIQHGSEESGSLLKETKNKVVEEIAEEIGKSAQEWSTQMMRALAAKDEVKNKQGKSLMKEDVQQFDLSMQSVSSQMGKKEMKAFTKFARIMRPKITEEFPDIMFTQIAGILADRWKALSSDEIKYYEKMAEVVDENRKIQKETKQNENLNLPEKTTKNATCVNSSLKSMFEKLKKKNKILRPPRKEILLPTSINLVKSLWSTPVHKFTEYDFEIIGKLHPSGNWLYKKGEEIGHVRHQGLRELIIFQKMLSSFSVPRKPLDKKIPISEENIGTVLWNLLISLESEMDSCSAKYFITSDVILKNGFYIEINKYEDVISSASITEIAESIPHFGVSELKDSLNMYHKNGEIGGLASWRPTSVFNFITNEAVRRAQQFAQPPDREEIEDMMNTYNLCFRHLSPVCLHSREIFPTLYNLESET